MSYKRLEVQLKYVATYAQRQRYRSPAVTGLADLGKLSFLPTAQSGSSSSSVAPKRLTAFTRDKLRSPKHAWLNRCGLGQITHQE